MPSESTVPYALTTIERVKELLAIEGTDHDAVLKRLVNHATDYFERACNGRRFAQTTYTNEVYTVYGGRQRYVMLRQAPVYTLTSFQWRSGTPASPQWVDFIPTDYELIDMQPDGTGTALYSKSGIIRVWGVLPKLWGSIVRATYQAGFPIDFPNAGNNTTHQLPADISATVENMVVRRFKRRADGGKSAVTVGNSTVNFKDDLDAEDREIIGMWKRAPIVM